MFDLEDKGNAMLATSRDYFPIEAPTKGLTMSERDRQRTRIRK